MNTKLGLAPIVGAQSHTLILGTLPGDESLRRQQYYANRRNQFWQIIEGVYGEALDTGYTERIAYIQSKGLALWDIFRSAERSGSSDGKIKNGIPNDFSSMFAKYPIMRRVVLAGGTCQKEWTKLRLPLSGVRIEGVPSSSGTPGRNVPNLTKKIVAWKAALLGIEA